MNRSLHRIRDTHGSPLEELEAAEVRDGVNTLLLTLPLVVRDAIRNHFGFDGQEASGGGGNAPDHEDLVNQGLKQLRTSNRKTLASWHV
jgi:hypothetical protein